MTDSVASVASVVGFCSTSRIGFSFLSENRRDSKRTQLGRAWS
uniref:Uncharacterized protein n=1 Tax=Rhizophora mucronata TaxID=61149 RepID=A0A2P2KTU1_RHIMU